MHPVAGRPPAAVVDPGEIRPRRRWFLVPAAVLVVAIAAGLVLAVTGVGRADVALQKLPDGHHGTVTFSRPDRYLYSTTRLDPVAAPGCTFTGPGTVRAVPQQVPTWVQNGGRSWYLVGDLHASATGTYRVSCPPTTGRIAVGASPGDVVDVVAAVLVGVLVIGGALLACGAAALVLALLRSSHRARLRRERLGPITPYR